MHRGIAASGISRDELFLTTKVWNDDHGYDAALRAFDKSLQRLQVEWVDLYLIHWPVGGNFIDTWKALERLYEEKVVRAIGVSNFHIHHLEKLSTKANISPMVNQFEFHPYLTQEELREYCREHQIQVEAYSPLMQGHFLQEKTILEVAQKVNRTPAQVLLRWNIQHGFVTIPRSSCIERIEENAKIFDFELAEEDMKRLDQLNRNQRFGRDPDHFYGG